MVKTQVGIHLIQATILFLKRFELFELLRVHATVFALPTVKSGRRDAFVPTDVGDLLARLILLQHCNDLSFGKSAFLHNLKIIDF